MDTYNLYNNVYVYLCQCEVHLVYVRHLMCAQSLTESSMPGGAWLGAERGAHMIGLVTIVFRLFIECTC